MTESERETQQMGQLESKQAPQRVVHQKTSNSECIQRREDLRALPPGPLLE